MHGMNEKILLQDNMQKSQLWLRYTLDDPHNSFQLKIPYLSPTCGKRHQTVSATVQVSLLNRTAE